VIGHRTTGDATPDNHHIRTVRDIHRAPLVRLYRRLPG
jgi:hypothetical protein